MKMKTRVLWLAFVVLILLPACSEKPADTSKIPTNPTAPQTIQHTETPEPQTDYSNLEVTPSGDPKCFLSPCDCNCYVIPNVPPTKKKPTCAINCKAEYGITGCRFTNYQCTALK